MATPPTGPTRAQRVTRTLLVAGYAGFVVLGFASDLQPRIFWTMLLPLLPISIVLMGFSHWRRICPLAFFGEIGKRLNRGAQRRVPRWFERWFFLVTFGGLLAMLVVRLVATNGDGRWLAGLLVALAVAAALANTVFTGKTWCNFFCPVSLVERIYTEPRSLPTTPNSQCVRCTACKSSCPDIDQENAYWRDLATAGRRIATYSFPGLVLAFYTYYWLRHGDWEAYFDGRWTRIPVGSELALGPGFFFAPGVPAVVAATITLVAFSVASYLAFTLLERIVERRVPHIERRRHLMLALAAFSAFSIFYVFAGAPTLRRIAGGTRVLAFAVPLVGGLFLAKRWNRTREDFIAEKGAARLLMNWAFDEPPPDDPREVYGWIKAREHAREQQVAAYANTVREMIQDGLVRKGEMRLLHGMREQLGITDREHEKVIEHLDERERDLFERGDGFGIERRCQLEGYKAALAEALLRHAPESELASLRRSFSVSAAAHDEVLAGMRGDSGLLVDRAREQVERIRDVRRDLEALVGGDLSAAEAFLVYLLRREQDEAICRVFDVLEIVGPRNRVRGIRSRLFSGDRVTRKHLVDHLADLCGAAAGIVRDIGPWIVDPTPAGSKHDAAAREQAVERRSLSANVYMRAAAVWVAGESDREWARGIVEGALQDDHPLVREAASETDPQQRSGFDHLATVRKMQSLRSVPLFAGLEPEDLHDLTRFVTEETFQRGKALCVEGDVDSDDVFILIDGRASVLVRDADSGRREVAVLNAGEIVGEMSMIDGSARSATVRPKDGPLRVLRISGQRFRSRLLPRARVARPLLLTLAERIRKMSH